MMPNLRPVVRRVREDERGWALVTAMALMAVMLMSGLALAAQVDTQTKMSSQTRHRETAFNLAEAALNAEVFALGAEWPGVGYGGLPASTSRTVWGPTTTAGNQYAPCTELNTGATDVRCPNVAELRGLFPTADAEPDANWSTQVIDNVAPYASHYSDAALTGAVGYDSNGDDRVWVRATATVKQRTRTIVSLVRAGRQSEDIMHAGVVAGSLVFGNMGANEGKTFIGSDGTSSVALVSVRCQYDPVVDPARDCLGYSLNDFNGDTARWRDALKTAVNPFVVQQNLPEPTAMTPDALSQIVQTARSQGTYFRTCEQAKVDAAKDKPQRVVVFDVHVACGTYTGGSNFYSAAQPGMLILLNSDSSVTFGGGTTFHGVVYHANLPLPGSSNVLVSTNGGAQIHGGVLVDGPGTVFAGNDGLNIKFAETGFGAVQSIATAGLVLNTWRELKAGS
jgi:hypothetical protein